MEKSLHNKPISGNTECESFLEVCPWQKKIREKETLKLLQMK